MTISTLVSIPPFTLKTHQLLTSTPTSRLSISPRGLNQNRTQSSSLFYPLRRNLTRCSSSPHGFLDEGNESIQLPSLGVKFAICLVFWASFSLLWFARSGDAEAAADSI